MRVISRHYRPILSQILFPDDKQHIEWTDGIARSGRVEGCERGDREWVRT
jgi:hypothetical protein